VRKLKKIFNYLSLVCCKFLLFYDHLCDLVSFAVDFILNPYSVSRLKQCEQLRNSELGPCSTDKASPSELKIKSITLPGSQEREKSFSIKGYASEHFAVTVRRQ
jgi:hypothetical protein